MKSSPIMLRAVCRARYYAGRRGGVPGVFDERPLEDRRPAADEARLDRGGGPPSLRARSLGEAGVDRRHLSFGQHAGAVRGGAAAGSRASRCSGRSASARPPTWPSRARRWPDRRPAFWRWKAAGTSRCRCRASAARKSGRWNCWRDEGVLVQPGFFYDFESEAFLIASLLTAPDVFREGIARLRRAV